MIPTHNQPRASALDTYTQGQSGRFKQTEALPNQTTSNVARLIAHHSGEDSNNDYGKAAKSSTNPTTHRRQPTYGSGS